jgi:uncharacterized membrane protein YphA (DoxX/SURF4 family)
MEILGQYHEVAGVFVARVFLGLLFLFQGYDAVFKVKVHNVIQTFERALSDNAVPKPFISMAAWFTSYTELICGALLVLGLFEYAALYLLALNLIIAAIGFGIDSPMWDTRHVFPRLALILFLLLAPQSWHSISLDILIFKP